MLQVDPPPLAAPYRCSTPPSGAAQPCWAAWAQAPWLLPPPTPLRYTLGQGCVGHLGLRLTTSPPRRVGPGSCSWRARLSYARGEGAEDTDKVRAPAPRPTPCCHSRATAGAAQGSAGLPAAGLPRRCADALARAWRSGHNRPNAAARVRRVPRRSASAGRSPRTAPARPRPWR